MKLFLFFGCAFLLCSPCVGQEVRDAKPDYPQLIAAVQDPVPDINPVVPDVEIEPPTVEIDEQPVYANASQSDRQIVRELRRAIALSTDEQLRNAYPEFWDNSWNPRRRLNRIVGTRRFLRAIKQDVGDDIKFNSEAPDSELYGDIGDGAILDRIIQFIENGGLEKILAFILAIIEALA